MDEQTETTKSAEDKATDDSTKGNEPKADTMLKSLFDENERTAKLNQERRQILTEEKEFFARKQLAGVTTAGQSREKPKETDDEYVDKFHKGEVNLFAE